MSIRRNWNMFHDMSAKFEKLRKVNENSQNNYEKFCNVWDWSGGKSVAILLISKNIPFGNHFQEFVWYLAQSLKTFFQLEVKTEWNCSCLTQVRTDKNRLRYSRQRNFRNLGYLHPIPDLPGSDRQLYEDSSPLPSGFFSAYAGTIFMHHEFIKNVKISKCASKTARYRLHQTEVTSFKFHQFSD